MEPSLDAQTTETSADIATVLTKPRRVRYFAMFENLLSTLSPAERLLLYALSTALVVATLVLLAGVNARASVLVPGKGGHLTEGVLGTARFINPLLAITDADRDLSILVYSGLTRIAPDGSVIPDLASSYQISDDGLTYTFILRPNLKFHDGTPLKANDIVYTVKAAQNPDVKSPRRADWEGVTVSAPDEGTIVFTLPRPYAPFIENTTLGILPAHLWEGVSAEEFPFAPFNTQPIGSGPFEVSKVETDKSGAATRYELTPFREFALGEAHLDKITFLFFSNETTLVDAWNSGRIESFAGASPAELSHLRDSDIRIMRAPLPRVFGVFFNQGHAPVLADASVRAALDAAVDKQALVNTVLGGYGAVLDSPVPPGILSNGMPVPADSEAGAFSGTEEARAILERGGWEYDPEAGEWQKKEQRISFALSTSDSPELSATAEALAAAWRAVGMQVDVHVYPVSELNTSIIRPRAYDAILFGEVVGRTLDLFAFWHSSQRNDPGLNLALYTNVRADTLLANARATTNKKERESSYETFVEIIKEEQPAVFLYAPQLLYVIPEKIQGVEFGVLANTAERFAGVHNWYTNTEQVWSIFTNSIE